MTRPTLLQEYIGQQPALWRALLDSGEEITGEFLETHDGEYPTEEYLTQEIEKRFQAMTSNGSATPETAA